MFEQARIPAEGPRAICTSIIRVDIGTGANRGDSCKSPCVENEISSSTNSCEYSHKLPLKIMHM